MGNLEKKEKPVRQEPMEHQVNGENKEALDLLDPQALWVTQDDQVNPAQQDLKEKAVILVQLVDEETPEQTVNVDLLDFLVNLDPWDHEETEVLLVPLVLLAFLDNLV